MEDFTVLLVEDSNGDVALIKEAIRNNGMAVQLQIVADGEQALQYLRKEAPYAAAPTPDLIFLDLNLPRLPGHDVLAAMHGLGLQHIPVVILSSSANAADVRKAYDLCANAYLEKPIDVETYFARVRGTLEYFTTHVTRVGTR
jgi:CheY-like chemotaxis protein